MATFGGKQPQHSDPSMRHEGGLATCTVTPTLGGEQRGFTTTIEGCIHQLRPFLISENEANEEVSR